MTAPAHPEDQPRDEPRDRRAPDELAVATSRIAGTVTTHTIAGGRHDLKGADDEVAEVVSAWVSALGPSRPRRRAPQD